MPFTTESAQSIFSDTQVATVVPKTLEQFNQLKQEKFKLLRFAAVLA